MALNPGLFALWTPRDKAAERRLALRYVFYIMKICAECQSTTPDSALRCPACASALFEAPLVSESEAHTIAAEPGLLSWDFTFKWVLIFLGATILIEIILGGGAYLLARNGQKAIAEGIAASQNVIIPIVGMLFFIWLSSTTNRPFARACTVYVWSLAISLLLSALSGGAFLSIFGWVLIGSVCAVTGTLGEKRARRPNPAVEGMLRDKAVPRR